MVHGADKHRSRRNRARIRDLFWREWDPIGVSGHAPNDEYNRYADKAYVMVMYEGRSTSEIADYFYYINGEYMGLGETVRLKRLADSVAEKLVALKPSLEAESSEPF